MIPKSIMVTVLIGLVSSLCFTISMCFSISDLEGVTGSAIGVPILEVYYQATGRLRGAVGLHILFLLTGFGCLIACRTLSFWFLSSQYLSVVLLRHMASSTCLVIFSRPWTTWFKVVVCRSFRNRFVNMGIARISRYSLIMQACHSMLT